MSEAGWVAIIVATIAGLPAILNLVVSNKTRQHARAARVQVENDHTSNLREDQDGIRTVVDTLADRLSLGLRLLLNTKSDVRGMRRDIGRVSDRMDEIERRLHDVEVKGKEQ